MIGDGIGKLESEGGRIKEKVKGERIRVGVGVGVSVIVIDRAGVRL